MFGESRPRDDPIVDLLIGCGYSDFPYIRVVGELEQFKGKNSVRIADIRKVSSPYEPYYHILHTICDSLVYERGPVRPSSSSFLVLSY